MYFQTQFPSVISWEPTPTPPWRVRIATSSDSDRAWEANLDPAMEDSGLATLAAVIEHLHLVSMMIFLPLTSTYPNSYAPGYRGFRKCWTRVHEEDDGSDVCLRDDQKMYNHIFFSPLYRLGFALSPVFAWLVGCHDSRRLRSRVYWLLTQLPKISLLSTPTTGILHHLSNDVALQFGNALLGLLEVAGAVEGAEDPDGPADEDLLVVMDQQLELLNPFRPKPPPRPSQFRRSVSAGNPPVPSSSATSCPKPASSYPTASPFVPSQHAPRVRKPQSVSRSTPVARPWATLCRCSSGNRSASRTRISSLKSRKLADFQRKRCLEDLTHHQVAAALLDPACTPPFPGSGRRWGLAELGKERVLASGWASCRSLGRALSIEGAGRTGCFRWRGELGKASRRV